MGISQMMPALKNDHILQHTVYWGWSYGFTFQHVFLHDRFWTPAPEVGQCQGQITTAGQLGGCQASVRRLETEKNNRLSYKGNLTDN